MEGLQSWLTCAFMKTRLELSASDLPPLASDSRSGCRHFPEHTPFVTPAGTLRSFLSAHSAHLFHQMLLVSLWFSAS